MLKIREMETADIPRISEIHREVFPNDTLSDNDSMTWISSKFAAWPVNRYFVAVKDDDIIGYILWTELGGLRNPCVLELEQIGLATQWQGKGFGARIVNETIYQVNNHLKQQGRSIKLVQVTTGKSNQAQQLYIDTLGAAPECKIANLYDEDEVLMIARISSINEKRKSQGLPLLEVK